MAFTDNILNQTSARNNADAATPGIASQSGLAATPGIASQSGLAATPGIASQSGLAATSVTTQPVSRIDRLEAAIEQIYITLSGTVSSAHQRISELEQHVFQSK